MLYWCVAFVCAGHGKLFFSARNSNLLFADSWGKFRAFDCNARISSTAALQLDGHCSTKDIPRAECRGFFAFRASFKGWSIKNSNWGCLCSTYRYDVEGRKKGRVDCLSFGEFLLLLPVCHPSSSTDNKEFVHGWLVMYSSSSKLGV